MTGRPDVDLIDRKALRAAVEKLVLGEPGILSPDDDPRRYAHDHALYEALALIDAAPPAAPSPRAYPDHTHRWIERSQDTLDDEYRQTGSLIGRWVCPDCYEETDVEPDQLRAPHHHTVHGVVLWFDASGEVVGGPADG